VGPMSNAPSERPYRTSVSSPVRSSAMTCRVGRAR
jgi:hypothetical protein